MISRASIGRIIFAIARAIPLSLLVLAVAVIGSELAHAIDGNYTSPYASQYDSRSTAVAIPNQTWIGMLLLVLNGLLAAFYALRFRRRQRPAAR